MNKMIVIAPGVVVNSGDQQYKINHVLDYENVLATDVESGKLKQLLVKDLKPVSQNSSKDLTPQELSLIPDEEWKEAERRLEIIGPTLEAKWRTRELIQKQADEAGVHISTIYRWIERYEQTGLTTSLLPTFSSGGRGKSRLPEEVEAVLQATIEEFKKKRKAKVTEFYKILKRKCVNAGLKPPHRNTLDSRIKALSKKERDKIQFGPKEADRMHSTSPGQFPGANFPLAVVQIDHTELDIMLVDDVKHLPIGRPWITVAIDVYSRMILGFEISFDRPNSMSVGLCLVHAILPKEEWLAKLNITTQWPCWGLMRKIHADNAGEFRGKMLKRACKEYNMNLEWRPVKKPNNGAYIERLLGTFAQEIHTLPGTTFSNPTEKGDYDSEKEAVMTESQFKQWLTNFIVGVYHQREHSSLGTSPIDQFERGIFGSKEKPGVGLPPRVFDENRLRLDLMPFEERTIQSDGVWIERIPYHSGVFHKYVGLRDPNNPKKKPKFIFKQDPHNIKFLYFYAPDVNQYFEVTYSDKSRPPMSIWELRETRKRLKELGFKDNEITANLIFDHYEKMMEIKERAIRETKAARLASHRRTQNAQITRPQTPDWLQTDETKDRQVDESPRKIKYYEIDDEIE